MDPMNLIREGKSDILDAVTFMIWKKMEVLLEKKLSEEEQQEMRDQIEEKYNWDRIAQQTIEVYRKALAQRA